MYNYFIAFSYYDSTTGVIAPGNCGITRIKPIANINDIVEIQNQISKELNLEVVIITNYQFFAGTLH